VRDRESAALPAPERPESLQYRRLVNGLKSVLALAEILGGHRLKLLEPEDLRTLLLESI